MRFQSMNDMKFLQSNFNAGIVIVGKLTKLKDGSDSPVYLNLRDPLWANPHLLYEYGRRFAGKIVELFINGPDEGRILVCGIPEAAVPLATATVLAAGQDCDCRMVQVGLRKEPKPYGAGDKTSYVIGEYRPGDQLFVLDDVITTSASKEDAAKRFEASGFPREAITFVVAFDRQQGGMEKMRRAGYRIESLFQILDVGDKLHEQDLIDANQLTAAKEFIASHQHA